MRRALISLVIVTVLLAGACTQPSGGGGATAAPAAPAAPASAAPVVPGY